MKRDTRHPKLSMSKPDCFGKSYKFPDGLNCIGCEWVWLCLDEEDNSEDRISGRWFD